MELAIATAALILSVCAAGISIMLLLKREDVSAIEAKQRSIELELTDVVDRLQVWQRRDASRQRAVVRNATAELGGSEPDQHGTRPLFPDKNRLRAVARERGLMR